MTRPDRTIMEMQSEYMDQYNAHVARQQRRRKRLIRRLVFFSIMVVVIFGVLTIYHIDQRNLHAEKQEEFNMLSEQMAELELQERVLREEIDLLSDEAYILDIAKTSYYLSNEGDIIFQLEELEDRSY